MLVRSCDSRYASTHTWLLLLLTSFHIVLTQSANVTRRLAKAEPGSTTWPSVEEWQALNTSISGRLIKFSNPGALCYGSTFDAQGCKTYQNQIANATWVGENPGLTNWPQWADNPCPPTASVRTDLKAGPAEGCAAGKYPSYIVKAQNAEDIAAAMKWAGKNGVRVSVKNTGHDFLGRNVGAGALSIWTRHLKGLEFQEKWNGTTTRTDISGQWKGAAVTYGSGNVWMYVNGEMAKRKHMVVSGAEGTVGAGGGWLQGGGHGPYSNQYGFGAEQVLEFQVVTAAGDILIANEQSNPDLFWALRGGGASTYGIVTRVTYKAYPEPSVTMLLLSIAPMKNTPQSRDAYYNAIGFLFSMQPNFTDCGISGYPVLNRDSYKGALMAPGKSVQEVQQCWNPMAARMKALGASVYGFTISNDLMTTAQSMVGGAQSAATSLAEKSGYPFVMGSRLLSRKLLSDPSNLPNITAALKTILEDQNMYMLPYPNIPGKAHQNREWNFAMNPAWKQASVHVLAVWNDGQPGGIGKFPMQYRKRDVDVRVESMNHEVSVESMKAVQKAMIEKYVPALDSLSENHGAYINEASPYEKDWKTTFYGGGQNYEKLLQVKRKYDPQNVLWCFPCVGGDVFTEGKDGKLYVTE